MQFKIDCYQDKTGKIQSTEFLRELRKTNKPLWEQVNAHIELIKDPINWKMPFSRPLGEGLIELRAKVGKIKARINYYPNKAVINLLNGYIKTDKKSQESQINLGRELLKDFKDKIKNEKN